MRQRLAQLVQQRHFYLLVAGILVMGVLGGMLWYKVLRFLKEPVPEAQPISVVSERDDEEGATGFKDVDGDGEEEGAADSSDSSSSLPLPRELNLEAAFYAQAPFGNWDYPWQEACEEASVLLAANAYFGHEWTAAEFNEEILELVDWQNDVFGDYVHTDMAQTARILEEYLGLQTVTHTDVSLQKVQEVLAQGHLIIMPFAGKEMGNPNFRNGGPTYHVILVKGYKEGEKLITHDVGTRNGADYVYTWDVLDSALHDYAVPIQSGERRFIEVLPPGDEGAGPTDGF